MRALSGGQEDWDQSKVQKIFFLSPKNFVKEAKFHKMCHFE